jgi:hypothetical protein
MRIGRSEDGGAADCGYTLYVAGNPWESFEGLLNFDITGNGTIELADLATWQQAYLHGGPLHECDFSLSNYCHSTVAIGPKPLKRIGISNHLFPR